MKYLPRYAFKMAALIVKLHEVTAEYYTNADDKDIAGKISGEVMALTRAIVHKHTDEGERAFKYHLAQPYRILCRELKFWTLALKRRMKSKTSSQHPWQIYFTRNLPLEVFDVLQGTLTVSGCGVTVKDTKNIQELHITSEENLLNWLLNTANKYGNLIADDTLVKEFKDKSLSKVIANNEHPFTIKYSKTQETVRVRAFYGYWNIFGIPQHILV